MGTQELNNRLMYYFACIGAFAKRHSMSNANAYKFLSEYKGMDFIEECYEAEHTLSLDDAVQDMTEVCKRNGGVLDNSKNLQFLLEFLGKEVTKLLMEEYGWDERKAMDCFLGSKTYALVEDEQTGLYFQSPVYIYSILKDELEEESNQ